MNKVQFETNMPEKVTLKFPVGHPANKIVDGRFGEQVYYSLADGRCMYLDLGIAQKLNLLEVAAGETVAICKRGKGRWDVWLTPETEQMRRAKEPATLESQLRGSVSDACERRHNVLRLPNPEAGVTAPAPDAAATRTVSSGHNNSTPNRNSLVDEANALVDAYAVVLARALDTYQGRIKPEEVRSILLSAYIQQGKAGKYAAA